MKAGGRIYGNDMSAMVYLRYSKDNKRNGVVNMHEYININGTSELITNTEDLLKAIYSANYEIAEELEKDLHKALTERQLQDQKAQSDMIAYESELEENRDAFGDILEALGQLEGIISSKRVSKDKAMGILSNIRKVISNVY